MLKIFTMFLHLLGILLKLSSLCRKKSRKVLTDTSNKFRLSKTILKLLIGLMILVEPFARQLSL